MSAETIRLYRTASGATVQLGETFYAVQNMSWDALVTSGDLERQLRAKVIDANVQKEPSGSDILAPIGSQEVWAAGVTYFRSRDARMEESKSAGGGDFYDRVYGAERPELFFKATPHRVAGPAQTVAIRSDSKWNVPEPELTL